MSVNLSQELTARAAELARSLTQLESSMNTRESGQVINERAELERLAQIDSAQESYNTMMEILPQIHDLSQEALIELHTNLFGISDTLGRLQSARSSLMEQVDTVAFDDSLRDLMGASQAIFQKVSASFTKHDAATEAETTLKNRVEMLASTATPSQLNQLQGFLKDIEGVHILYFTEQFAAIKGGFSGNAQDDFNSLLPLMGSLTNFTLNRNFVSEKNGAAIAELTGSVHSTLQEFIADQKAKDAQANSGSNLKGQILTALDQNNIPLLKALLPQVDMELRGRLFDKINEIRQGSSQRSIAPGAMGMINRGNEPITAFATVEQCKQAINDIFPDSASQESVADELEQLLNAITLSFDTTNTKPASEQLSTQIDEEDAQLLAQALAFSQTLNVSTPVYPRETLEKKIAVVGFFKELLNANNEVNAENLQLLASLIEEIDAGSAHAIYGLQFWLHKHLGKYVAHSDYGRLAFFGDLPPNKAQANATQQERAEVINRAFIKVLLNGIQEAIRANDNESLNSQLDQLSAIRLDNTLPGYYAHPNLEHRIRGLLYNAHVEAGFSHSTRSHWKDFGKAALRNEDGCNVDPALKLAAIAKLDEELRTSWGC